jgi:GNAT superfamily N-acetyltransferase
MKDDLLFDNNPSDTEIGFVKNELKKFNDKIVGDDNHKPIGIIVKNDNNEIIGGRIGGTYWGWLYIDRFRIHDQYRNRGIGTRVLRSAEDEAKKRGCFHSHVDTHDFQAVNFYIKQGYPVRCELEDLPKGHSKYLMTKVL